MLPTNPKAYLSPERRPRPARRKFADAPMNTAPGSANHAGKPPPGTQLGLLAITSLAQNQWDYLPFPPPVDQIQARIQAERCKPITSRTPPWTNEILF